MVRTKSTVPRTAILGGPMQGPSTAESKSGPRTKYKMLLQKIEKFGMTGDDLERLKRFENQKPYYKKVKELINLTRQLNGQEKLSSQQVKNMMRKPDAIDSNSGVDFQIERSASDPYTSGDSAIPTRYKKTNLKRIKRQNCKKALLCYRKTKQKYKNTKKNRDLARVGKPVSRLVLTKIDYIKERYKIHK